MWIHSLKNMFSISYTLFQFYRFSGDFSHITLPTFFHEDKTLRVRSIIASRDFVWYRLNGCTFRLVFRLTFTPCRAIRHGPDDRWKCVNNFRPTRTAKNFSRRRNAISRTDDVLSRSSLASLTALVLEHERRKSSGIEVRQWNTAHDEGRKTMKSICSASIVNIPF